VSRDHPYRGFRHRGQRRKSFNFTSGEVTREIRDHPSEEDRWQRSRDLANSEVRKVRAQELGAPSREWRSHENHRGGRTAIGSRNTGGPLDQNSIALRNREEHWIQVQGWIRSPIVSIRGSEVERTSFRHQKS
jgi:hypothetical protein